MIVVDTSGLLAAMDRDEIAHEECREALERDPGPFLLSPFVVAEADYLTSKKLGQDAETRLLREVARSFQVEVMTGDDIETATNVIERYSDLAVGLADASNVVLAARAGTNRILTLDERHFRAMRPLAGGRSFKLLPADA